MNAAGYKVVKVREVITLIEDDGWYLARTKGDHRQYKHPVEKGLVTISRKLSDDVAKRNLK